MKNEILDSLDETTDDLLETIRSFTQEQFNKVPFEGSWTAAQVAEHVLKAEAGLSKVWQGHTEPTQRPPDEKAKIIESIFMDFSTKMNSPEFILPSNDYKEEDKLYNAIKANRAQIKKLAESIDLTQTFTDFSMPQLGYLTGIESATFIICHSKRHIHQMKNIYEKVGMGENKK